MMTVIYEGRCQPSGSCCTMIGSSTHRPLMSIQEDIANSTTSRNTSKFVPPICRRSWLMALCLLHTQPVITFNAHSSHTKPSENLVLCHLCLSVSSFYLCNCYCCTITVLSNICSILYQMINCMPQWIHTHTFSAFNNHYLAIYN